MKGSPHKIKHTRKKAIRSAQKKTAETDSKQLKSKDIKKSTITAKRAKINRGKADPKHRHHKTSPKEVTWETEPESIHKKGARWLVGIQKKTLETSFLLKKRLNKIKFFKGKK